MTGLFNKTLQPEVIQRLIHSAPELVRIFPATKCYVPNVCLLVLLTILSTASAQSNLDTGDGSFAGTWKGKVVTTSPPGDKTTFDYRFVLNKTGFAYIRQGDQAYTELGPCVPVRLGEVRLHCVVYRSSSWNEIFTLDLVRLDEDRAYVYVRRVVDNPSLEADDEDRHFSFDFEGTWQRIQEGT